MVRLDQVSVARGGLILLDNLCFDLTAGSALVLRGRNGIGKTSLLRTIAGIQPLAGGRIDRPDCAYFGHSNAVKGTLSVSENLAFWRDVYGTSDDVKTLTEASSIPPNTRASDLSAGQKQRLGLDRLILSQAPLWLLDEPTASLDVENTDHLIRVLQDHLSSGGTAILSTHIDVKLPAKTLDLESFEARRMMSDGFDEVFV